MAGYTVCWVTAHGRSYTVCAESQLMGGVIMCVCAESQLMGGVIMCVCWVTAHGRCYNVCVLSHSSWAGLDCVGWVTAHGQGYTGCAESPLMGGVILGVVWLSTQYNPAHELWLSTHNITPPMSCDSAQSNSAHELWLRTQSLTPPTHCAVTPTPLTHVGEEGGDGLNVCTSKHITQLVHHRGDIGCEPWSSFSLEREGESECERVKVRQTLNMPYRCKCVPQT